MNVRNLSLEERTRVSLPSVSLPSIEHFDATARNGENLRVARPGDYYATPSVRPLHYGQPPQHAAGHTQPAFTGYRQSHGQPNASVESTPSTAYSSPRLMANHHQFDNCSISSSSRESSVYSGAPSSSVTVQARATGKARSTRAKRGSDSQGSNSEHERKRPSVSSRAGLPSGDEFDPWCETCNSPFHECSTPKGHERKSRKITKEKASRGRQAEVLQLFEDLLGNRYDLSPLKLQMPGNQKKSGLWYDKQELLEVHYIASNLLLQNDASAHPVDSQQLTANVNRAIRDHIAARGDSCQPQGSLLAPDPAAGAEPLCVHETRGLRCDSAIECRKAKHAINYNNNMARLQESGPSTPAAATAATAAATVIPVRSARPAASPQRIRHEKL